MIPWPYILREEEQLLVSSLSKRYVINGPGFFVLPPLHSVIARRNGISLSANEYAHIKDEMTAQIRLVTGPCFFFLGPSEEMILHQESFSLAQDEYVRICNRSTGHERVVTGEASVFLYPFETVSENVRKGIILDSQTAVAVRNLKNGELRLERGDGVFFPKAEEKIEGPRYKIRLEEHEVLVLKDEDGKFHFHSGKELKTGFFVPPYWEVLTSRWSSGLHKDQRELKIERFDLRPKFMWYEFDVRTRDNVELTVKITFFWQIVSVTTLVRATDDASGDVCARARSRIIQSVSTVDFADFLARFNVLVHDAVINSSDSFYKERGLEIHSVEVREIACRDKRTQDILAEIIQETTDRMNRIQKQVSENEISMRKLDGELASEEAQSRLQAQQLQRFEAQAKAEGERQALVVRAFLEGLGPDLSSENKLKLFELLRRKETLEAMAKADTRFFLTRDDMEIKLDFHG